MAIKKKPRVFLKTQLPWNTSVPLPSSERRTFPTFRRKRRTPFLNFFQRSHDLRKASPLALSERSSRPSGCELVPFLREDARPPEGREEASPLAGGRASSQRKGRSPRPPKDALSEGSELVSERPSGSFTSGGFLRKASPLAGGVRPPEGSEEASPLAGFIHVLREARVAHPGW